MSRPPLFSFVATSRNDDHGGDVLRRTQSFISRLAEQAERHELPCELIIVEWNPPKSRAPLADVLAWPAGSKWFSARIITVPRPVHGRLKHASRLAMFQMIAKNVGIRRAKGENIIATNIDIIFSDELFSWLKSGNQTKNVLYRSDRWDIPNAIQIEPNIADLLGRARLEAIRRNLKDGTYVIRNGEWINTYGVRFDHTAYFPLQRLFERLKKSFAADPAFSRDAAIDALNEALKTDLPQIRREYMIPILSTNGCGDFTMMSREDWFDLRGYPEWPIFSWAIDSIIVFQAYYNRIRMEELEPHLVHYHIEHDYGSGWTPEGATSLWSRLDQRGIPYLKYYEFNKMIFDMQDNQERGQKTIYNDEAWGFCNDDLPERIVVNENSPYRPPLTTNTGKLKEDFLAELVSVENEFSIKDAKTASNHVLTEWGEQENGAPELTVTTLPQTWSYSVVFMMSKVTLGEYWIKFSLVIVEGNIGVGVVNLAGNDFLTQSTAGGPSEAVQELFAHVPDSSLASQIVIRNVTPENRIARYRILGISLLREAEYSWEDAESVSELKAGSVAPSVLAADSDTSASVVAEATPIGGDRKIDVTVVGPPQQAPVRENVAGNGVGHPGNGMTPRDEAADELQLLAPIAASSGNESIAAKSNGHASATSDQSIFRGVGRIILGAALLGSPRVGSPRAARQLAVRGVGTVYAGDHKALARLHTGEKIYVDTRDVSIASHLMTDGRWEPWVEEHLDRIVRPGMIVLDVGASFGYFSLRMAARMRRRGQLIAVEPNREIANLLRYSVSVNGLDSVVQVVNKAAYHKDTVVDFRFFRETVGAGTILNLDPNDVWDLQTYQIEAVALDNLIPSGKAVDVVKISTEGAEPFVIAGMKRIIRESPNITLLFDLYTTRLATPAAPRKLLETLSRAGFRLNLVGRGNRGNGISVDGIISHIGQGFACISATRVN